MSRASIFTLLAAAAALLGPVAEADEMKDVVEAGNAFTVKLYGELAGSEGNLFFSPASIHTALGMTYAGARGRTARQIAETLQLDEAGEAIHRSFGSLLSSLNSPSMVTAYELVENRTTETTRPAYQLVVANALWGQKGYPWNPEFVDLTAQHYGAGLRDVDFANETEAARKTINDWVEEETKDRIKDLIPAGALDTLTRLVLTNAVYFKANWAEEFSEYATESRSFHISAGKEIQAPLMSQTEDFRYMETGALQALEMPYKSRELSMVVFLPKKIDGLGALEASMTGKKLDGWMQKLRTHEVEVTFPKFKFTSSMFLARILRAMGMTDAFSDSADFSGMTPAEEIFISEVIHKAFVAVDEEGTEAAAATGVMMAGAAAPMKKPKPKIFKADHPFLFLIRHSSTGSILFMGRVVNPTK